MIFTDRFCEICGKELIDDDYCRIVFCGSVRKVFCQEHFRECIDLIDSWQRGRTADYAVDMNKASRVAFRRNSVGKGIFKTP